jgi:hypothetical protein
LSTLRHRWLVATLAAAAAFGPVPSHAYVLTTFGQSIYDADTAAMDAAIGISGMSIEDFSDTALIPRLSIAFENPAGGPLTTLPANFTFLADQAWDNPGAPSFLINRPDQLNQAPYSDTTFIVDGGTSKFGIGLSNFQTVLNETDLVINGINFGLVSALPNYVDGGPTIKNLYLLVSAEAGDALITTVKFDNLDTVDAHLFDHVAIDASPVPLPSTIYLLGAGLAGLAARAKRPNRR